MENLKKDILANEVLFDINTELSAKSLRQRLGLASVSLIQLQPFQLWLFLVQPCPPGEARATFFRSAEKAAR
jgi:hypothetical protein